MYLLPGSPVRLEHADDHPRAIVKTYMESVREHLIAGTFRKKVHDPPAVAFTHQQCGARLIEHLLPQAVAFAACLDAGARGSAD